MTEQHTIKNPWDKLKAYTDARIALGRSGTSIPTKHWLEFQLAHAQSQDAVHAPLNVDSLKKNLLADTQINLDVLSLHSQAIDRPTYLQRPDLGRRLDESSRTYLKQNKTVIKKSADLLIVIADGLSSLAIEKNTQAFLRALLPRLRATGDWQIAPLCIVEQGRVAIGDQVGEILNAKTVLVLIGERPGLSSPDSLGLYLTWAPKVGLTDAYRNCISNIREAGMNYETAATKTCYLLQESRRLKLSGVNLKENAEPVLAHKENHLGNFLTEQL